MDRLHQPLQDDTFPLQETAQVSDFRGLPTEHSNVIRRVEAMERQIAQWKVDAFARFTVTTGSR